MLQNSETFTVVELYSRVRLPRSRSPCMSSMERIWVIQFCRTSSAGAWQTNCRSDDGVLSVRVNLSLSSPAFSSSAMLFTCNVNHQHWLILRHAVWNVSVCLLAAHRPTSYSALLPWHGTRPAQLQQVLPLQWYDCQKQSTSRDWWPNFSALT